MMRNTLSYVTLWAVCLFVFGVGLALGCRQASGRSSAGSGIAESYPPTTAELQKWYEEPPTDENAALVYERILRQYRTALTDLDGWFEKMPKTGAPFTEITQRAAEAFLKNQQPLMELLREAGKKPRARFSLNLAEGPNTELPHLSGMRSITKFLSMAAVVDAAGGKSDQAVEALTLAVHTAESLADEPMSISQLVRIACHSIIVEKLGDVLGRTSFTDVQLRDLDGVFAAVEERDTFYRGIVGERAMWHESFQRTPDLLARDAQGRNAALLSKIKEEFASGKTMEEDRQCYHEVMGELIRSLRITVEQRLEAGKRIGSSIEALPEKYYVSRMILPPMARIGQANLRDVAFLRCARGALAAERVRLAKGHAPAAFSEVAPSYLGLEPVDPFNGNPLVYAKKGEGFSLYSCGANGKDDGGLSGEEAKAHGLDLDKMDFGIAVRH
jgi:hypothetical protein